jgi:hypothetical protein
MTVPRSAPQDLERWNDGYRVVELQRAEPLRRSVDTLTPYG